MKNQITIKTKKGSWLIPVNWRGDRIAIHAPVNRIDKNGKVRFFDPHRNWSLTHIATGRAMGRCHCSYEKALAFAQKWDNCAKLDLFNINDESTWPIARKFKTEQVRL
jgi:hypothetical protein